jgi:5'-nucleotidase (lipoprotein e(P4) family)
MRKVSVIAVGLMVMVMFSGCASKGLQHECLNGILWVQTALEHHVICEQVYETARLRLDEGLNDISWTAALEQGDNFGERPPAVILDADETILDNSPFQARLEKKNIGYNDNLWNQWVREAKAEAILGAREFIRYAKAKGVEVFYVTNRDAAVKPGTVENIKAVIDPDVQPDHVLCRNEQPDWGSNKSSRRAYIAKQNRIILLLGDDYNDFAYLGKVSPKERLEKANAHRPYWGKRWLLLPNVLYGSWESALLNYDYTLSPQEKARLKSRYLKTAE